MKSKEEFMNSQKSIQKSVLGNNTTAKDIYGNPVVPPHLAIRDLSIDGRRGFQNGLDTINSPFGPISVDLDKLTSTLIDSVNKRINIDNLLDKMRSIQGGENITAPINHEMLLCILRNMGSDVMRDYFEKNYDVLSFALSNRECVKEIVEQDLWDIQYIVNEEGEYLIHNEKFPSVVLPNDEIRYYRNGLLHRKNGPAVIDGEKHFYYFEGQLHCIDGPAVVDNSIRGEHAEFKNCLYFVGGVRVDFKNFEQSVEEWKLKQTSETLFID